MGMPYPNPTDPELQERMRFFDKGAADAEAAGQRVGLTGGSFYEGLCMKAVNQCVGRVIRHQRDYAAIVLADERWVGRLAVTSGGAPPASLPAPVTKLPGWIQRSWVPTNGEFGQACSRLAVFFRKQQQSNLQPGQACNLPAA